MDKLRAEEHVSPEPTWPDDLTHTDEQITIRGATLGLIYMDVGSTEVGGSLRKSAYTLGRISDVPDFDVSSGDSEDEAGRIPEA